MYLLFDYCSVNSSLMPLWTLVGIIVKAIWIGIPILLIILGSIDLGKAVIASKEDEVKKAKQAFLRRLLYAVAVFAVVWLVGIVINFISTLGIDESGTVATSDWRECWSRIIGK